MLPIVVLILAGLYFALYYSGAFERFGETMDRFSTDVQRRSSKARRELLDGEVERRLKVFEDFLSDNEAETGEAVDPEPPEEGDDSGVY